MRFEHAADIRRQVPDDGPGQQHAAGFSADHAGADHMIPDTEVILWPEVLFDEYPQALVAGHHDVAHPAALLVHGDPVFMQYLGLVEETVPGIHILFFQRPLETVHHLVEPAGLYTVPDRKDGSVRRTVKVGEEHGFGIAVPDLLGPDIYRIPVRIGVYVQEQLGRIHDFGDRVEGMPSADDREERDRIENEQERAGDPEKIAHHQVGGPGGLQFRKAVEHIEGIAAFLFDMPVDFHRKRFEPVRKRYDDPFYFRTLGHQLGMAGKPEIDDLPPIPFRLFHKRVRKTAELAELRYPPDHVIAHPDIIQRPVQRGNAGIHLIKGSHGIPPVACMVISESICPENNKGVLSGLPCLLTQVYHVPAGLYTPDFRRPAGNEGERRPGTERTQGMPEGRDRKNT